MRKIVERFGLAEEVVDIESMPEFDEFLTELGMTRGEWRICDRFEKEELKRAFRQWYYKKYVK
jgi:hypothetical protein